MCLLVVVAGCGGGAETATTDRAAAQPMPAQALAALIDAARTGDSTRVRSLLTPESAATPEDVRTLGALSGRRPRTLYRGGDWAVAWVPRGRTAEGVQNTYAAALKLVRGRWRVDLSRRVRIRVLGPDPGETADPTPQVAAELTAPTALAESGLWVDGVPLQVKGGGSPTRGTIYGAPPTPLAPGGHAAVAFARTTRTGTATAWMFSV